MPLSDKDYHYENMIYKNAFNYYFADNMINGIMIDLDNNALTMSRKVYGIDDLAQEVGGFLSGLTIFIGVVF